MFLTENDINYYLYAKPPPFWIELSVCIVASLGFAFLAVRRFVRWIYSVPLLLFTNASPATALREYQARKNAEARDGNDVAPLAGAGGATF